ncbi:sulfotransferase family 2 domain-containing protein [Desulfosediminicola flagellatus]|uniref:sulfotransferase family 2 domain-containing protein n=1 Tax=Desulfosediminicola flagellatus TaxID=2569541 RepID=UPI0010ACA1D6|nr:sulfotransferase family 2 domain-containing protein [Desulfosediminicola flagellatus]
MICHHYKCVFIHIPKNAGQSIEHVFLKSLGLTWETRASLLLRENGHPALGPPRLAHLKAQDYVGCNYLSQELFDTYYRFTFVRNPWSRVVSLYKYLGYSRRLSFKDFLKDTFLHGILPNMYWFVCPQSELIYSEDGELLVDYIGRFETLQSDFDQICMHIGFPQTPLPHINISREKRDTQNFLQRGGTAIMNRLRKADSFPSYASYCDYYDQETFDIVADIYQKDIDNFKYSFRSLP